MSDNPFAALIANSETNQLDSAKTNTFSNILECIFGFTLNKVRSENSKLLFLEEIFNNFKTKDLDLQILHHALFDRLFMCSDENGLLSEHKNESHSSHAYESQVITYIYNCYQNILENKTLKAEDVKALTGLIFQNVATAFKQPDIYYNQDIYAQLIEILKDTLPYNEQFFVEAVQAIQAEQEEKDGNESVLEEFIGNIVSALLKDTIKMTLMAFDYKVFRVMKVLVCNEITADIFISKCHPMKPDIGIEYANTLLGSVINVSITPKTPSGQYEHFLTPLDHASNAVTEGNLWTNVDKLTECIYDIIKTLLKCSPTVKDKTLTWIGNCLKANADRGKLWSSQAPAELNPASYSTVSDGFMINLTNVLLRLSIPFCTREKILKIDPTYCAVPVEKQKEKSVHLPNTNTETCLIPAETVEGLPEERLTADSYSFLSECFYLTHRAFDLGYRIACERIVHLNQELGRVERAYNDAMQQVAGNSEVADMLKDKMAQDMTRYLCHKAQLLEPVQVKMMFDFASSTSYWLSQVVVHCQNTNSSSYAPLVEIPITFPLAQEIPNTLKCIPEFIVENIVHYLICQRRFNPSAFEEAGYEKLRPILTFILIFMGSKERMKNPHIRARLAEALESLLPYHKDEPKGLNRLGSFQRQMLFEKHEHRNQIIPSLLEVFVGIEMTGQNVEFEQKFNYRRPMYVVMDYLWNKEEYQECFKTLAEVAEKNMEAVSPPLFLRFVNLLLNDAVFLLDEALASMAKLREMQTARENGEWDSLPANERAQNMGYLHHTGMIARFDNILGKETIKTLEHLTSKITIVFTHPTMVDRVAAMLNYFLFNLVGPNKKNFKVKDQKEYSFDPAATVLDICKIYVNLKDSDAFCLAVSQDGRSYSPQLFDLAEDVLVRIGGGSLIGELKEVAEKVAVKAKEYQYSEEIIAEAPDHFIDPIMSTVMTDPVILPSSRQTVDRTTIARHLLSDQTDPFNRAPLSMDQIIPNTELAEEIRKWKEQRRKAASS